MAREDWEQYRREREMSSLDTDTRTGKLQKDVGEDRILIDKIIRYFTDAE